MRHSFPIEPRKKHQFSRKKPCYFCGAPSSGREHAPPAMMFRDLDCKDPIVVPSCDEHNTAKGESDRAIVLALLKTWEQQVTFHSCATDLMTENIAKAMKIAQDHFPESRKLVTLHPVLEDPPDGWDNSWPRLAPEAKIGEWIRQLTAAVAWSATGDFDPLTKWHEANLYSRHFYSTLGPEDQWGTEDFLQHNRRWDIEEAKYGQYYWYPGWNNQADEYPQDIYRFRITFLPAHSQREGMNVVFRHTFYNSLVWYVWVAASERARRGLVNMIGNMRKQRTQQKDS